MYSGYFHYSFFHLLNHVISSKAANLRVLDLACGNAIIGRKIKLINPSISVVGIDVSDDMLNEAHRLQVKEGITEDFYLLKCDAKNLPNELGCFHCVVSAFFLAMAPTRSDLFVYFQQIHEHLLPGGMTVHVIPVVDPLLPEGNAERVTLQMNEASLGMLHYHWLDQTYKNAAITAGLTEISIQPGAVCPRG